MLHTTYVGLGKYSCKTLYNISIFTYLYLTITIMNLVKLGFYLRSTYVNEKISVHR